MTLPHQSAPVVRTAGVSAPALDVTPSNIACDICNAGCSLLSGIAKTLCQAACSATVC